MTDVSVDEMEDGVDGDAAKKRKKGLSGKKIVLFFLLPVLLLGGGAAGAYFGGLLDGLLGKEEAAAEGEHAGAGGEGEAVPPKPVVFYDMPEMLINLSSRSKQPSYLKLAVALELEDPNAIPQLEQLLPRLIDNFQVYLREMRPEDLNGSAGMHRLKEELLKRVNTAMAPVRINDVLFKEMLVQ